MATSKKLTTKAVLTELRSEPTISVPMAGKVLGGLSANASYRAAEIDEKLGVNRLGVRVLEVGGRKRVVSIDVLRKLGLLEGGSN